jgi:hypothetical protein
MGDRCGSPTGKADSGTLEGLEQAIAYREERGSPELKWFFRHRKPFQASTADPTEAAEEFRCWEEQTRKIDALRERFQQGELKLLYREFDGPDDFREALHNDPNDWLSHPDRPWFRSRSAGGRLAEERDILAQELAAPVRPTDRERFAPLLHGMARLAPDSVWRFDQRVVNFLAHYLDTEGHPVPFGGRTADLAALDVWLEAPDGPAYRLLAAPAGRGKSALLSRWIQRISDRPDLALLRFCSLLAICSAIGMEAAGCNAWAGKTNPTQSSPNSHRSTCRV